MRAQALRRLALVFLLLVALPRGASAYSVLAHEAMIDAVWDDRIAPLLRQKFPRAPRAAIDSARAYAYGGSLIQDLGYYPFGSHFFSDLLHYVRSGDFVEAMVSDARDLNEYAFALGALAHYASDSVGHPHAVNRVVPLMYPKLRAKFGPEMIYADSPARHVMVEFAFDVDQVARGTFRSDAYQDLIGFQVAMPLLERAFRSTYGLELEDLFGDEDLAIGTYRWAASRMIPEITRTAWKEKREEILAKTPAIEEQNVVYTLTQRQYEEAFGTKYRKPGIFARFVVAMFKILPKVGPFRPLAFEPLTAETERMFRDSFDRSRTEYRAFLAEASRGRLTLEDTDLDTGRRPARGANPLADRTYAELLEKLEKTKFASVPAPLQRAITAHYASADDASGSAVKASKQERRARARLAAMNRQLNRGAGGAP